MPLNHASDDFIEPALAFLAAEGEMADRMRRYDWSDSPIGYPSYWSSGTQRICA